MRLGYSVLVHKIAGVNWQAQCMHCAQRTPKPWMAEAGLLARQDAELRAILDRKATRWVAGRTPRITNSPGANLSQLAKRFEPVRAEHMDVRAKSSHPDHFFLKRQQLAGSLTTTTILRN